MKKYLFGLGAMLVGAGSARRGKEPMGAVFGMGVWGLDPVSKPAIGGTVVGQLALLKTNGLKLTKQSFIGWWHG